MQREDGALRRTAEGGLGRNRGRRPPSACGLSLGLWGSHGRLGAPTRKTTKASLLSPGRGRWGGNYKRLLITSIIDRVSNGVILFISELGVLFKFS